MGRFYCSKLDARCAGKDRKSGQCLYKPNEVPCKSRVNIDFADSAELIIGYLHELHAILKQR